MMYWYLAIITTVLVVTQIIRVTQNAVSLHRQSKVIDAQLHGIKDITEEDLDRQRRVYKLAERYLESKVEPCEEYEDVQTGDIYIGDDESIKSCPVCGGRNIFVVGFGTTDPDEEWEWSTYCDACDHITKPGATKESSIANWNNNIAVES